MSGIYRRVAMGLLTLAIGSGIAACGSAGSTASTPGGGTGSSTTNTSIKDVCALATTSEIGTIIKQSVTAQNIDYKGFPSCKYTDAGGDLVQTNANAFASVQAAKDFFASGKGPAAQAVTGVGDEAAYDGYGTMTVRRGNLIVGVTILAGGVSGDDATITAEKQIVQLMLGRIK